MYGFDIDKHVIGEGRHIGNDLWVELDGDEGVPTSCNSRFYHPTKKAKRGWPAMLKTVYGIKEQVFYDVRISGLINEIDSVEMEEYRKEMFQGMIDSKTRMPVPPPDEISNRFYLELRKGGLMAEMSANRLKKMFSKSLELDKEREFTDFEKRLLQWRADYGFLIDYREKKGFFGRMPDNSEAFKHEVEREYLFCLPEAYELVLSVAQEPNTDKAIWGLRREMNLDWPFDSKGNTFSELLNARGSSIDDFVKSFNSMIKGIEEIICD